MTFGEENAGQPAWLHLLRPLERAWREGELLKGINPDRYLEGKLRAAGRWPQAIPSENGERGSKASAR